MFDAVIERSRQDEGLRNALLAMLNNPQLRREPFAAGLSMADEREPHA